jgi:hypothetical protein
LLQQTRSVRYSGNGKSRRYNLIKIIKKENNSLINYLITFQGNVALVERYETMVETRNEQISLIKAELKHFKNEHFKNKVAELLQFIFIQLDFPESYENHFSKDLRIYLSACRRYRKDLIKLAQDINQEFKTMSPKPELPAA